MMDMEVKNAAAGRRSSTSISNGNSATATTAVERKEIERNRRLRLKNLSVKLASLIPKEHSSKDAMTQLDSLDEAAAYIKKLKERVDELQRRRNTAARLLACKRSGDGAGTSKSAAATSPSARFSAATGSESELLAAAEEEEPVVEVRHNHDESGLEVVLITSVERPFRLHEVVTVLEEEGAEVINASFSVDGRKIFYTIHSQAFSTRIGIDVSRVSRRLRAL
ncbi:hypothetical protein U9M48_007591, partial [Paspalum notatum var. saurae]